MSISAVRQAVKDGIEVPVRDLKVRVLAPKVGESQGIKAASTELGKKMAPFAKKVMEAPTELLLEQQTINAQAVALCLNTEIASRNTDDDLVSVDEAGQIIAMAGGDRSELVRTCMMLCGVGSGNAEVDQQAMKEVVDQIEGPTSSPEPQDVQS